MNTKTFLSRATCAGLFAALVAAAPLKADEWMKFGVGLHIASPSGDLTNEKEMAVKVKTGFGFSAFGELGLNKNMALRGRVDYNVFGEGEDKKSWKDSSYGTSFTQTVKHNANATTVFVDYIYSFDSHEKGFYVFAGLGLVSGKNKWDIKVDGSRDGVSASESDGFEGSGSNLGVALGCGYSFNKNMGLELSWASASDVIEIKDVEKKYDYDWMQVSFKYRF